MATTIHLTVRVLPPKDLDNSPDPVSLLMNVNHDVTFFTIWKMVEERYKIDYRFSGWVFKKIQDAYGADISLSDSVGACFAGEDRTKCVIHVLQIQSHRENTVPEGSFLRPRQAAPTEADIAEAREKTAQELRYGATIDTLDPDHPVQSGERELGPDEQEHDKDGFRIPRRPSRKSGATSGYGAHTSSPDRDFSLGKYTFRLT